MAAVASLGSARWRCSQVANASRGSLAAAGAAGATDPVVIAGGTRVPQPAPPAAMRIATATEASRRVEAIWESACDVMAVTPLEPPDLRSASNKALTLMRG